MGCGDNGHLSLHSGKVFEDAGTLCWGWAGSLGLLPRAEGVAFGGLGVFRCAGSLCRLGEAFGGSMGPFGGDGTLC